MGRGKIALQMLDWISQNKQWVFSGAGITVLAAVWWFLNKAQCQISAASPSISNTVTQSPVITVAPVINVFPQELKRNQARELIEAIADVRILAQEAKTAAEVFGCES